MIIRTTISMTLVSMTVFAFGFLATEAAHANLLSNAGFETNPGGELRGQIVPVLCIKIELEAAVMTTCTITVPEGDLNINMRSEPSTDSDVGGTLAPGETATVIGQTEDADGFKWWELENSLWVREDVVNAGDVCAEVIEAM